ncbi:hypothetical protein SOVF_047040 isoform B [Spinacia oleracea]|nr:hypothetical protein SOVF_047040 isoform B [Spinacia oleracea]
MNGMMCPGRAMCIGAAANKKSFGGTGRQEALSFRAWEMVTSLVCCLV